MLNQDSVMMVLAGLVGAGAIFGAIAKAESIAAGRFVPRGRDVKRSPVRERVEELREQLLDATDPDVEADDQDEDVRFCEPLAVEEEPRTTL